MAEKHYEGGCQCGAVRYEVNVDVDQTINCNCSRCKSMGFLLAFAPRDQFILSRGEHELTEYLFNKKEIRHLFCRICGIESFAYGSNPDGSRMAAINVNCLDGVDIDSLTPQKVDGASM